MVISQIHRVSKNQQKIFPTSTRWITIKKKNINNYLTEPNIRCEIIFFTNIDTHVILFFFTLTISILSFIYIYIWFHDEYVSLTKKPIKIVVKIIFDEQREQQWSHMVCTLSLLCSNYSHLFLLLSVN